MLKSNSIHLITKKVLNNLKGYEINTERNQESDIIWNYFG